MSTLWPRPTGIRCDAWSCTNRCTPYIYQGLFRKQSRDMYVTNTESIYWNYNRSTSLKTTEHIYHPGSVHTCPELILTTLQRSWNIMIQYIVIEVVNCTLQFPCRFNGHNNDVRLYMHVGYNFKTHLIRQTQWF